MTNAEYAEWHVNEAEAALRLPFRAGGKGNVAQMAEASVHATLALYYQQKG
jgi:hypothetical protein